MELKWLPREMARELQRLAQRDWDGGELCQKNRNCRYERPS